MNTSTVAAKSFINQFIKPLRKVFKRIKDLNFIVKNRYDLLSVFGLFLLASLFFVSCDIFESDSDNDDEGEEIELSFSEDCLTYNIDDIEITEDGDGWLITDGVNQIMVFEEFNNAKKARDTINGYGLTSQCFVGRPDPGITYWLNDGQPPVDGTATIEGEDCLDFNRNELEIEQSEDLWRIVEGNSRLFSFDEYEDAEKALEIIQAYGFDKTCFIGRPDPAMMYFLSDS